MPIISVDSFAGTNGYRIVDTGYEVSPGLRSAFLSLSAGRATMLGDVNGDGLPDILWADEFAQFDPFGQSGRAFVVFGQAGTGLPNFTLESINGSNGFFMNPTGGLGFFGGAAAAGDVNGDGFDDVIVSVPQPGSNRGPHHLVVFGQTGAFPVNIAADMLTGANGFAVTGAGGASQIGAGDFNGDGFSDIVVGSGSANAAYVIFGKPAGIPATIDVSSLDGSNGFVLTNFGSNAVANAGDMNGDGIDDLVVSNPFVGGTGGAFVVYGRTSFSPTVNLMFLNPSLGVYLNGDSLHDRAGESVSSAGDVNGDGYDDLIIGAIQFDVPTTPTGPGKAYVVFGGPALGASIELSDLDGTNGFAIIGEAIGDLFGLNVASAGDFNDDGFDDIIVTGDSIAAAYLIYGRADGFQSAFTASSLNQQEGLLFDQGVGIAGGRDINGDGLDDLLLTGSTTSSPGLIFGSDHALFVIHGFAAPRMLAGGATGDRLSGAGGGDSIDGLGGDDTLRGRSGADSVTGGDGADQVFGGNGVDTLSGEAGNDTLRGEDGDDRLFAGLGNDRADGGLGDDFAQTSNGRDTLLGGDGNDTLGAGSGNDLLNSAAGADLLLASNGADRLLGGDGNDTMLGGGGRDTLTGGAGNDRLVGGTENDGFNFAPGSGADLIVDFEEGAGGGDVIRLIGFGAVFDDFTDVLAAATQVGNNVVIDLGGGDAITLQAVALGALNAGDFAFG